MKRISLIILTVATILSGSSCSKVDNTTQSPLSLMSMSIIPDYSNGSIKCCPEPFGMSEDGLLSFKVEILPLQYLDEFGVDDKYVYRASFRKVVTKSESDSYDFTLDGTVQKYEGADFLTASFILKPNVMEKIKTNDYMVSFFIGDAAAAQSVSTAFVPLSSNKGTNNNPGNGIIPEGALQGVFSVSDTRKVYFSKGNLYFDNRKKTMCFEENQFDAPLTEDEELSGHIGHFYWSSNESFASRLAEYNDPFSSSTDVLFTNHPESFEVNGNTEWGVLTGGNDGEWKYLIDRKDQNGNVLYKYDVSVCDHPSCLIVLPDNWKWGENGVGNDWQSEYSEATTVKWSAMEAAGAVCLPPAGYWGTDVQKVKGVFLFDVSFKGCYWSASPDGSTNAFGLSFTDDNINPCLCSFRENAYSIRLVTDAN